MKRFKIGDRVRTINDDSKYIKGLEGVIISVGNAGFINSYYVQFNNNYNYHTIYESELKLVEPKNKFKVGDRVMVISDKYNNVIGLEGVIEHIYFSGAYAVSCNKVYNYYTLNEHDLELVESKGKWDNIKVHVSTPEISEAVQKELFKCGYNWGFDDHKIQYTESKYLFCEDMHIMYVYDAQFFREYKYKEVTWQDILGEEHELVKKDRNEIINIDNTTCEYNYKEESSMEFENIKKYSKVNLAEAKKKAEEEKAYAEVVRAKFFYEGLINDKNKTELEIRDKQEELKELNTKLKIFEGKK